MTIYNMLKPHTNCSSDARYGAKTESNAETQKGYKRLLSDENKNNFLNFFLILTRAIHKFGIAIGDAGKCPWHYNRLREYRYYGG